MGGRGPATPQCWGDSTEPQPPWLLSVDGGEVGWDRRWAERHWCQSAQGTRGTWGVGGGGKARRLPNSCCDPKHSQEPASAPQCADFWSDGLARTRL